MRPTSRIAATVAALTLLTGEPGSTLAQDYAPIMPLADRSLLLDLSTAGSRVLVAGERGHILFSDDGGINWQQAKVPTTQMLTGIHFVDEKHGWAAGHDGLILASDDGGRNWRVQRDGLSFQHQANLEMREKSYQSIKALRAQLEVASEEERPALDMALDDATMDLEDADLALSEPVFTAPFMDIWFQDRDRGWAVGAFGSIAGTRDGGTHWDNVQDSLENPDEFHLNSITGDGRGRIFIAGEGGVMFRSLDDGDTWEALPSFYEGSWFGTVYDPLHNALLVFGLRGNLFRSTDFGSSWEPVQTDNNITLSGGSVAADGSIVLVGGVGTVLRSSDGGQSFTRSMISDRLSLSSGLSRERHLILIGQGGAKLQDREG